MATFVLQKCKLRDGWLVPVKNVDPITVEWPQLCEMLAPTQSLRAKQNLRMLSVSSYVGLVQTGGGVVNFVFRNADLSGDMRSAVRRDPSVADRLVDAYRVDSAVWDGRVIEPRSA